MSDDDGSNGNEDYSKRHEELRRDFDLYVRPNLEIAHHSREASVAYARDVLRGLFLINAGALAALPVAIALFEYPAADNVLKLAWIALCFVSGFFASIGGSICGYFSFGFSQAYVKSMGEIEHYMACIRLYPEDANADDWTEIIERKREFVRRTQLSERVMLYLALAIVLAGFAGFTIGVFQAGEVLFSHKSEPEMTGPIPPADDLPFHIPLT